MKRASSRTGRGVTLIELLIAILILSIAVAGMLNYQYYSIKQSRMSKAHITAVRTAMLLMDDWKNVGGDENYNPEDLGVGFVKIKNKDLYRIDVDGFRLVAKLFSQDEETDDLSGVTLRRIKVRLWWRNDFQLLDEIRSGDPECILTTFVCRDCVGG